MIRFRDFSIKNKLFAVFGLSFIFMGGIIIVGLLSMLYMREASRLAYEESFVEAQRLFELEKDLEKNRRALLAMIVDSDRNRLPGHIQTIKAATKAVEDDFNYMLDNKGHSESEVTASLASMRLAWDAFRDTRDNEIIPAILGGRTVQATRLATGVQDIRFKKFIDISQRLVERENKEALAAHRYINTLFADSIMLYTLISIGGFSIVSAALIYLSRDITKRLKTVTDAFDRVRNGALDFKMEVSGKDELGAAASDLNKMVRQLYEDRVMLEQSETILQWYADESGKKVEELERLNSIITETKNDLDIKNISLEESVKELREMNQKLTETKLRMIQSEKMATIGQLAAGVAHEINNPLGYINSNINSLQTMVKNMLEAVRIDTDLHRVIFEGTLDDCPGVFRRLEELRKSFDFNAMLEDINNISMESEEGIGRILSITNGLKDFAHASGMEKQQCDINRCIDNTVKLWFENKCKAEIKKDLGEIPSISCNPQQISQVLMNIIVNAAYAITEKGEIRIKTYALNGDVFIEISDTGSGMPADVIDRIFEPFFTTKPVGKGTGLGLSIAYGIVKEHNGSIDVKSKHGEGTMFTVRLPVQQSSVYAADSNVLHEGVL